MNTQLLKEFGIHIQKDIFDFLEDELKNLSEKECKKRDFQRKVKIFKQLQALPLDKKVEFAKYKIEEFYNQMDGKVYISFSGGKDSLVLLHLVKSLYSYILTVFVNTTNEAPELIKYIKTNFPNTIILKPNYTFKQIVCKYGFPLISKEVSHKVYQIKTTKSKKLKQIRLNGSEKGTAGMLPKKWHYLINSPFNLTDKCCYYLKKQPLEKFEKETNLKSFVGTTAQESMLRFTSTIKDGCNIFTKGKEKSRPISIFTTQDIWLYIKQNNLPYCELYDQGETRLGCQFCCFGIQYDPKNNNRFHRLYKRRPKQTKALLNLKNNGFTYYEALKFVSKSFQFKKETNENFNFTTTTN